MFWRDYRIPYRVARSTCKQNITTNIVSSVKTLTCSRRVNSWFVNVIFKCLQQLLSKRLYAQQQGCYIWHQNWVRLVPNGTKLGLFNISSTSQNVLKQICQIWHASLTPRPSGHIMSVTRDCDDVRYAQGCQSWDTNWVRLALNRTNMRLSF